MSGTTLQTRADADAVSRAAAQCIPDAEARQAVMSLLAEAIEHAHRASPASWVTSHRRNRIRLVVGAALVLGVRSRTVQIAVVPERIEPEARSLLETASLARVTFRRPAGGVVFRLPPERFAELHAALRPAMFAFIDLAATACRRSPYTRAHTAAVVEYLEQDQGRGLPRPTREPDASHAVDLQDLLEDFRLEYVDTAAGRRHFAGYTAARAEARRNLERIDACRIAGEPITERVLLGLLPHTDTAPHRASGAWIHVAPAIQGDVRAWFEASGWARRQDWPGIADAVLEFVTRVTAAPDTLSRECERLARSPHGKGLQAGMLSPVLNAIAPDHFSLVNSKVRKLVQALGGPRIETALLAYPSANEQVRAIARAHAPALQATGGDSRLPGDVLDALAHWYVTREAIEPDEPEGSDPARSATSEPARHAAVPPTLQDVERSTRIDAVELDRWLSLLRRRRQIVLQGPPGTGKTFVARQLARVLAGADGLVDMLQFHAAYAYEDFIQGLRPVDEGGRVTYRAVPGHFPRFCARAEAAPGAPCVLILDEINRANLARVFGELMYLLEYRGESLSLALDGVTLRVPENVHIIGTMNTADRSIARIDHALRRRFAFVRLRPDYRALERHLTAVGLPPDPLVDVLRSLNQEIDDPDLELGTSFFLRDPTRLREDLPEIWRTEIEPYLEELFYPQLSRVERFRWEHLLLPGLRTDL